YCQHGPICLPSHIMSSHTLIRSSAGGVKRNQCSLDCIIEEIDVHNKAHVLYGIIDYSHGRFANRPYNDNGNHTSGQPHGIAPTLNR
ncbi:MAG: hypothetical protein ACYS3N_06185, partial [Planctomycetota bacterium]